MPFMPYLSTNNFKKDDIDRQQAIHVPKKKKILIDFNKKKFITVIAFHLDLHSWNSFCVSYCTNKLIEM